MIMFGVILWCSLGAVINVKIIKSEFKMLDFRLSDLIMCVFYGFAWPVFWLTSNESSFKNPILWKKNDTKES